MGTGKEQHFDLYYRRGWVYLTVHPNSGRAGSGGGRDGAHEIYPEEVENRMRLLGIPKARHGVIREVIEAASGRPHPLVEWPEGARLAAQLAVTISDDEMSATVTITPAKRGAAPADETDVQEALQAAGVTFGFDPAIAAPLLARAAHGGADVSGVVAQGREPVFGRSRRVEYRFKTDRGRPYLEMPFGRINLRELNFIDNRKRGDLLAILLPPVEAVNGSTVTGTVIPAERDDSVATIPAGENTRLSADGAELYATIDGNVTFRDGNVVVEPVVEVENVDYATGNIHFDGSVVVHGHVADGFVVEATGNIQVGRSVGRARLSAGENILLQSGMNGNAEGTLECKGNLFARYLESCTVRCRGNIFVEEAIMHSSVTVWHHCILNGRRAEFIGGDCVVGGSFWCRKLGNQYDVATTVAVGVPPELLEEYRSARAALATGEDRLEELDEQVTRLERAIREGRTDEKVITAREQLTAERDGLRQRVSELRHQVPPLKERLAPSGESVVVAEEVIHAGVIVTFGTHEYRPPPSGSWKTVLTMSHGEIHAGGFDLNDPPTVSFETVPTDDGVHQE